MSYAKSSKSKRKEADSSIQYCTFHSWYVVLGQANFLKQPATRMEGTNGMQICQISSVHVGHEDPHHYHQYLIASYPQTVLHLIQVLCKKFVPVPTWHFCSSAFTTLTHSLLCMFGGIAYTVWYSTNAYLTADCFCWWLSVWPSYDDKMTKTVTVVIIAQIFWSIAVTPECNNIPFLDW